MKLPGQKTASRLFLLLSFSSCVDKTKLDADNPITEIQVVDSNGQEIKHGFSHKMDQYPGEDIKRVKFVNGSQLFVRPGQEIDTIEVTTAEEWAKEHPGVIKINPPGQ